MLRFDHVSKSQKPKVRNQKSKNVGYEILENRQLLASVSFDGSHLSVNGTSGADSITITASNSSVQVNGESIGFARAKVICFC